MGRMILSLKGSGWMPCHFWSSLAFWFDGRGSDWEQQQSTVLKTASGLTSGNFSWPALWNHSTVGVKMALDE